ncbi:hypothetical protein Fmac_027410 [Flemingia macrophylla]|uniref:Uncharacterized protein n=1 Tax=Flemingia macrophylla TaxID=520843 RepID=A0ABD1LHV7_9FABA
MKLSSLGICNSGLGRLSVSKSLGSSYDPIRMQKFQLHPEVNSEHASREGQFYR